MNDKAFEKKVNRDIDRAKKDIATLGDDGVAGLSRKAEQLADNAKEMVRSIFLLQPPINQAVGRFLAMQTNDKTPLQEDCHAAWQTCNFSMSVERS